MAAAFKPRSVRDAALLCMIPPYDQSLRRGTCCNIHCNRSVLSTMIFAESPALQIVPLSILAAKIFADATTR